MIFLIYRFIAGYFEYKYLKERFNNTKSPARRPSYWHHGVNPFINNEIFYVFTIFTFCIEILFILLLTGVIN